MKEIKISDKLYKDLFEFCKLNQLQDLDRFIIDMIIKGFNITKYGVSPFKENKFQFKKEEISKQKDSVSDENTPNIEETPSEQKKQTRKVRIIKNNQHVNE